MKKVCRLVIAVLLILIGHAGLFAASSLAEDYPDRASNPLEADAKPAIGNIAGIKLSIPHHYMPRGVHYKGEELWTQPKTPPPPRTFESEIEDFGLLLRQSNYQPVKTAQDSREYLAFNLILPPSPDKRWLVMDVGYPENYIGNKASFQQVMNRYMEKPVRKGDWGPFILQEGDQYGLKRAVSQKPEVERSTGEIDELFFDSTTESTLITCKNFHQVVPPFAPLSSCEHHFTVPDIQSVVHVYFVKEDLSRWAEREREVKKVISSFIVK